MPEPKEQRFYKINGLHKVFAIASVVLLVSVIALWTKDYVREWKSYQRQFRKLEVQKAKNELAAENESLKENEEYQELTASLKDAKVEVEKKKAELQKAEEKLTTLEGKSTRINQQYNFTKADYEVAKYKLEAAEGHAHGDPKVARANFKAVMARLAVDKKAVDASDADVAVQTQIIGAFNAEVKKIDKDLTKIRGKADLIERKLAKIDVGNMSFMNKVGDFVRNMPVMDMLAPYYKIEQAVITGSTEDMIFLRVPRVDRCLTCHQGILKAGFEDEKNPFKTHPNPELYLSSKSPHPYEDFGCTSCHGGRGRSTDFYGAVHSPSSEKQKKVWEKNPMEIWETTALSSSGTGRFIKSSFFKDPR